MRAVEQKTHIAVWQMTRRASQQRFRNHPGGGGLFKLNGVLYSRVVLKIRGKSMCSRVRKSLAILWCVKGDKARAGRQGPDLRKLK